MIHIVEAPIGARISDKFSVWVRQESDDWKPVSVYLALTPDGTSNWIKIPNEIYKEFNGLTHGTVAEKTYVTSFVFDGEVEVRICFYGEVETFNIKPLGSVVFEQTQNEIQFTIDKPCKLDIEPDGDILGCLHLFAEMPKEYQQEDYEHVIHFEKGFHTAENNKYIKYNNNGFPVVTVDNDNTLVYAEQGAVVCANVEIVNASHVKVAGYGIYSLLDRCYGSENDFDGTVLYSGFREYALPTIYVHAQCEDIVLQDVTLFSEFRGVSIRNAKKVLIDNVKIFSHAVNGDGINGINVCDMEVKNCYVHSSDDSFALFTSVDSITTLYDEPAVTLEPLVANISMHDCILWTNARAFMIGGHATNKKEPHDVIENIKIYDCQIVGDASDIKGGRTYGELLYWSGVFRILSQSEQLIRNISFENVRFDWTKGFEGKPIHIEVRGGNTVSYSETGGGYRIENLLFKDINFVNLPEKVMQTYIKSVDIEDRNYGIENVIFENVVFDETKFCKEDILCEGNVSGVYVI